MAKTRANTEINVYLQQYGSMEEKTVMLYKEKVALLQGRDSKKQVIQRKLIITEICSFPCSRGTGEWTKGQH